MSVYKHGWNEKPESAPGKPGIGLGVKSTADLEARVFGLKHAQAMHLDRIAELEAEIKRLHLAYENNGHGGHSCQDVQRWSMEEEQRADELEAKVAALEKALEAADDAETALQEYLGEVECYDTAAQRHHNLRLRRDDFHQARSEVPE